MEPEELKKKTILEQAKVIAMVGLSPDEEKASNRVARYLMGHGYKVIPVNPNYEEVLGQKAYPSLDGIPGKIDVIDVFMKSERVMSIMKSAVELKPRAIWLQLDIVSEEARKFVEERGIAFVMNACMKQEHEKMSEKLIEDPSNPS